MQRNGRVSRSSALQYFKLKFLSVAEPFRSGISDKCSTFLCMVDLLELGIRLLGQPGSPLLLGYQQLTVENQQCIVGFVVLPATGSDPSLPLVEISELMVWRYSQNGCCFHFLSVKIKVEPPPKLMCHPAMKIANLPRKVPPPPNL